MTSDRPYRVAMREENTLDEITENAGTQLIANLFDILAKLTGNILADRLMQEVEGLRDLRAERAAFCTHSGRRGAGRKGALQHPLQVSRALRRPPGFGVELLQHPLPKVALDERADRPVRIEHSIANQRLELPLTSGAVRPLLSAKSAIEYSALDHNQSHTSRSDSLWRSDGISTGRTSRLAQATMIFMKSGSSATRSTTPGFSLRLNQASFST